MSGSTIIANVQAPESIESFQLRASTKNIFPKSPYTMDGIPESVSVVSLITLTNYSTRYIAQNMPRGAAIARDTRSISKVFTIAGSIDTFSVV